MISILDRLKSLELRADLAMSSPQELVSGEFLVQFKLEGLALDSEGKLLPKIKLLVGGINDDIQKAIDTSVSEITKLLDNSILSSLSKKGVGYDFAISQPFPQKDDSFIVVGKLELFDLINGKLTTLSKVSFNVVNLDANKAQNEALKGLLEIASKLNKEIV